MGTPYRIDRSYKLHKMEVDSCGAIVSRARSLCKTSNQGTTRISDGWIRKYHSEGDDTLVILSLSSLTENLKNLTATLSPFQRPFRRSAYVRVANGIPLLIFSSSPMRQELGSRWNAPHNRLRIPKAVLFRRLGKSAFRRTCRSLNPYQTRRIRWISYPCVD